MRTLSGRVREVCGVGATLMICGVGEGVVKERVRAGEGVGAGGDGPTGCLCPNGETGKEGMRDETEDQRRADECPLMPPGPVGPSTFLGTMTGVGNTGGGGATGLSHFSKKRMTGMSALIVACEFDGELGKGR